MRIGLQSPDLQGVSRGSERTSAIANQMKPAPSGSEEGLPEDTVTISSLAMRALQTPEIREDQVGSLRQEVLSGQYKLDPQAIADAMLNQ